MVFTVFLFEARDNFQKMGRLASLVSLSLLVFACYALISLRAVWTSNILLGFFIARYATLIAKIYDPLLKDSYPETVLIIYYKIYC